MYHSYYSRVGRSLLGRRRSCTTTVVVARSSFTPTTTTLSTASSSALFSSTASSSSTKTSLFVWGTDKSGCLLGASGSGKSNTVVEIPVSVDLSTILNNSSNSAIRTIVCGVAETAIITTNGECLVAGENKMGQLGVGHVQPVTTLQQVHLPRYEGDADARTVDQVALGMTMAAWIDNAGDLYTAGSGGSTFAGMGGLGHGSAESYHTPTLVESLLQDGCAVKQVTVGESHMTVLTTEGEVLTAGAGSYGRLGNLDTVDQLYFEPVEILTKGVQSIAGGKSFTLALTDEGVLYGWGRNHKGQLGTGFGLAVDMYAMQSIPEPVETDELVGRKVIKVAAGHSHAVCITAGGEMFYWGMSLHLEPVRVNDLLHTKVVDVVCGEDYTLAVDQEGKMYSFGKGKNGTLGQGSVKQLNQATFMEAFGEKAKVKQVSAGWKHAACLVEYDE